MKLIFFLALITLIVCDRISEYQYIKNLLKKGSSNLQSALKDKSEKTIDFTDNYVMLFPLQGSTAAFTDKLTINIDKIHTIGDHNSENLPNISLRMVDLQNFSYKKFPEI